MKSARIPAKKLLASGPKSLPAGHIANFQTSPNFLEGKKCKVCPAPFAVRLFEKDGDASEDMDTMVEPDISVVCDNSKQDKHGCKGAPDLVVEILSQSTQRHDQLVKLGLYQRAGVREYWIAGPEYKNCACHAPGRRRSASNSRRYTPARI